MHLGLFSFDGVRFFIQFLLSPLGKWPQVPRIYLCCSSISATFGFPSSSTECLHAQSQIQVLKSQDHCAKPGQVATILQLKGSKETIFITSINSWKASANLFPQHSRFDQGHPQESPLCWRLLWGEGSPMAWPLQPDTQLGDGFPFPFPKRIFNVLESFIFHNRARNKSTGPRHAPAQTSPPGCNRSCQEASEQLGIEAGGASQRVPACGESSPGRGQPESHCHISVPEESPTQERINPNSAST